jgi:glycosyltransferase involved in cell wall biosynthesis/regulator of replication initiation timing
MRKIRRQLSSSSSERAGLVSVIVATRDRPNQLVRLLKSIRRQTYKRLEIIVVNDAHDSDVTDLAKRYFVNKVVQTRNVGAAAAFNRGFLSSKGEFVIFSDDDLEWDRMMITKLVKALKAHPLRAYAYCGFRNVEGEREYTLGLVEFDPQRIFYGNYISGTSLVRRRKFVEVGMFDSSLKRLIDWDLWLSFLEGGEEGVLVPEILFKHVHLGGPRISDDSNPNSLPYAIAYQLVERKHSALMKSKRADDPLVTLLQIYWMRDDLQDAFPEVKSGEYQRLMEWAGNVVANNLNDVHLQPLTRYRDWFTRNPWRMVKNETVARFEEMQAQIPGLRDHISQVESENARLVSEITDLRSRLATLQAHNTTFSAEWKKTEEQLDKTRKEIEDIRSSFGYRVMRFYASRIDGICPDGTRRGRVRKRLVASLRAFSG